MAIDKPALIGMYDARRQRAGGYILPSLVIDDFIAFLTMSGPAAEWIGGNVSQ